MNCTELVISDHAILRRGLMVVDGMLKKLEDGQRIEIFDAAAALKFLRLFGDQYHQVMEENVLFPALIRAAPNENALRQLVSEHGDERMLVSQIEEALISKRGMLFFRSSHQLTSMLRKHCEREELILGRLAGCLSAERDAAIVEEFTRNRAQVEIHVNLSRLERKYALMPLAAAAAAGGD
jgi:hemerythrin-like domain-containing protein